LMLNVASWSRKIVATPSTSECWWCLR
jgi:hypothetical protein